MQINRRNFLKLGAYSALGSIAPVIAEPQMKNLATTLGESLNPTLVGSLLSIWSQIREGKKLIESSELASKNLSQAEKAYNNADAYAQSAGNVLTYSMSLTSRLPVETAMKLLFSHLPEDKLSQVTTISVYHVQNNLATLITSFFTSELRSSLITILENKTQYKTNPLLIPPREILNQFLTDTEGREDRWKQHLDSVLPKRNQQITSRDLLDLGMSAATFPISITSNTGFARTIGSIPRMAQYYRPLLAKDLETGTEEDFNIQNTRSLGNLILIPLFAGMGGGIQEILNKVKFFDSLSLKASTHLKDLVGMTTITYLYNKIKIPLQVKLETELRKEQQKEKPSKWFSTLSAYLFPFQDSTK